MNFDPVAGDRWTRSGETDLEVLAVKGDKVRMSRGPGMTIAEYMALAAATVRSGGTLHRPEIEEFLFE